jgi:hypothetical protein
LKKRKEKKEQYWGKSIGQGEGEVDEDVKKSNPAPANFFLYWVL